ncbi:MAG TPA: alpha/beta hydrolase [Ktedonobacterales bacterium]|nr:alpha/beta hydrolase [Ktedonobacterales bacterium]
MLTIQTRAGTVAYEEEGTGVPLVLLHANPGDHHHFDDIVSTLARSYRTIALDWPGYGESAPPNPPQSATAMLFADVLEDAVEALHLEPAIFLGNSVGGYAAARLAIRHPERVRALILVDSGGFASPSLFNRLFCQIKGSELITRLFATQWARFYLKRRTPLVKQIIADVDKERSIPSRVAVDAALWRSFFHPDHDLRQVASRITAPTLLIYGRYDPAIPFKRDGRNAQAALPHAQFTVLETGHEPFAEDPDAFLQAITPFLQSITEVRSSHAPSNSSSPR